jgi:nicotinamidase-related amidase
MSGLSPSDFPEYLPGMGGSMNTKVLGFGDRPALILVDVCKAYFDPSSPLTLTAYSRSLEAPSSMRKLVVAARSGKVPVIWTQVKYEHVKLKDAGLLAKKNAALDVFQTGDSRGLGDFLGGDDSAEEGTSLQPDVEREETILYRKRPSAFLGTNMSTQLQALGVDTLVICGACTSGSVRSTALDSMQYGFRTMVS